MIHIVFWLLFFRIAYGRSVANDNSWKGSVNPFLKFFTGTRELPTRTAYDTGDKSDASKCPTFQFPLGPVVLETDPCLDVSTRTLSACAWASVLAIPKTKLGCVEGSISGQAGLSLQVDTGIFNGSVIFYEEGHWLRMHYDIGFYYGNILDEHLEGNIELIRL